MTSNSFTPPESDRSSKPLQPAVRPSNLRERLNNISNLLRRGPSDDLIVFSALLLAGLPPALVFLDRWLEYASVRAPFESLWRRIPLLGGSAAPPYFILIGVCATALLLLLALRRSGLGGDFPQSAQPATYAGAMPPPAWARTSGTALILASTAGLAADFAISTLQDRLPGWTYAILLTLHLAGWALREVRPRRLRSWARGHGLRVILLLYVHLSLVGMLASLFGGSDLWIIAAPTLILALIALYRRRIPISPAFWLTSLALVLFSLNINAWWFSIVGDEHAFYTFARWLIENESLTDLGDRIFSAKGVYGSHPAFSTLLQVAFMRVFGAHNFGWRFSNLYLAALSVGFFYLFFQAFVPKRVALLTGLFLASSHYLMSFGKIGYNNLQALFAMGLALLAASWAAQKPHALSHTTLGACLGLCFYVYPAALFVPPVALLLVAFYRPPSNLPALRLWGLTLAVCALTLAPLTQQPDYWSSKLAGTLFNRPELTQDLVTFAKHIGLNVFYAANTFLYAPDETHFVAASYVDPITGAFVLIGAGLLLRITLRQRFARFIGLSGLFLLLTLGATHDRALPSTTRMFLLLPWFALTAALGATWLGDWIRSKISAGDAVRWLSLNFALLLIAVNLVQAYPFSQARFAKRYQSLQVLFLRDAQTLLGGAPDSARRLHVINIPRTFLVPSLYGLMDLYQIPYAQGQITEINASDLADEAQLRDELTEPHSLVIIAPWVTAATRHWLEDELWSLGKRPYEVRNSNGVGIYDLWLNPDYGRIIW